MTSIPPICLLGIALSYIIKYRDNFIVTLCSTINSYLYSMLNFNVCCCSFNVSATEWISDVKYKQFVFEILDARMPV
jgi:hypothetical protein